MTGHYEYRHAVRALLVREDKRVLLIHTFIPDTQTLIWLAPGGGIEAGEDPRTSLFREILEETGLRTQNASDPVWHRQLKFHLHGKGYDQYEDFYWVPTANFEPDASANPAVGERDIFRGFKWWSQAEIEAATDEIFVPLKFASHFATLLNEGLPSQSCDVGR